MDISQLLAIHDIFDDQRALTECHIAGQRSRAEGNPNFEILIIIRVAAPNTGENLLAVINRLINGK